MPKEHLEKIYVERPGSKEYILQILRYGFTFTCIKEIFYLTAYYIINHVKGLKHISVGPGTRIRPTVLMRDAERIKIGKNCTINHNNILWAGKKSARIVMGNHVMTGPGVQIYAFNHGMERQSPMINQAFTEQEVSIGDDVWIGGGTIILPGVNIGSHVVIAAGSVVTKDLPSDSICRGVPASVISFRNKD